MTPSRWLPAIVACVMLAWALVPSNPYGYYVLLRVVVCGVSAWQALLAFDAHRRGWGVALAVTALVYNPVLRVHLDRPTWSVLNVLTIALLAGAVLAPLSGRTVRP